MEFKHLHDDIDSVKGQHWNAEDSTNSIIKLQKTTATGSWQNVTSVDMKHIEPSATCHRELYNDNSGQMHGICTINKFTPCVQ